ncbi:hypothetical protein VKT23_018171 [Stygiomarasmius scandens]|uniref:Uncharacterized protein n=1 Tax=Marasmiellus scandens TaxID=2682957 RepID=A0ABR1IQ55_9AGAR
MSILSLSPEVVSLICSHVDDAVDTFNLLAVTGNHNITVDTFLANAREVVGFFLEDKDGFLDLLDATNSVVTGSSAVWVGLLGMKVKVRGSRAGSHWRPRTLDVLTPTCSFYAVIDYLVASGLTIHNKYKPDWTWMATSLQPIVVLRTHNPLSDVTQHANVLRHRLDNAPPALVPAQTRGKTLVFARFQQTVTMMSLVFRVRVVGGS